MLKPADIICMPAPMTPPMPAPSGGAFWIKASAPGSLVRSVWILSGGPSLARKARMMPTAVSAVARSTPSLATRRPISSSIVPSPAPYFWHVLAILYVRLWRDKAAASKGGDCRGILVRTTRHVAKEQRSGGSDLENQADRFTF